MPAISSERWQSASPYLDRVLDLPPSERDACLLSLWSRDAEVAADVEAMLAEHHLLNHEGFLNGPALIEPDQSSLAGLRLGAYTLVSPIGQGGMGSVWLAERNDGRFHGRAALKLLNAALVGRASEARFKREGSILARLTHAHIARLIDAGVSNTGQPYLVLEHVEGRHIDQYCDDERLGVDERIRLFLDVQGAVAHAHARLIVHRDLKPSNVLVTSAGDVKLLDFGIAKLLEHDAADEVGTVVTREGEFALTPKYAAPEQVTGRAITTATDVYALGVLLFELLTGQHPTGADAHSPAEFVKAVTDTEPQRLSATMVGADSNETAARAARRATTPERLRRLLQGDLETVVGKALKHDPAERYGSVAEFADDLRRVLDHQPIAARGDALGYRTAKFLRRHRRVVITASLAASVVLALSVYYTARLSAERDRARVEAAKASKVSELLTGLLTGADPYRTPDAKEPTIQNLLDIGAERVGKELQHEPELQADMLNVIGRTYERMGLHAKALPPLERALEIGRRSLGPEHVTLAQTLNNHCVLYREQGNLAAAEPLLRESLAMRRRLLGSEDKAVAITLVELGRALGDRGRSSEAEPLFRESLAIRRKIFGEEHRETATSKSDLGRTLMWRGDLEGAEPLLRENVATTTRLLGPNHPNSAAAQGNLALLLLAKGQAAEAEALLRDSLVVKRQVFGDRHIEYAQTLNTLGIALERQGRLDEAQAIFEECVRIGQTQLTAAHPRLLNYATNLARVRIGRGERADVEPSLRHILAARRTIYPAGDWHIDQAHCLLMLAASSTGALEPADRFAAAPALRQGGPVGSRVVSQHAMQIDSRLLPITLHRPL
jgi:serine/threonine protein kinase/Flp pilus assembly protein TadD